MKLVLLRCGESAKPFVADSFVRSYRGGDGPLAKVEDAARARALRQWLNERWSEVHILTGADAPDLFLGWVLVRAYEAWYCYVKHDLRRNGLARAALSELGCDRVLLTNHIWQEEWRA